MFLDAIVGRVQQRLEERRKALSRECLIERCAAKSPTRGFRKSLTGGARKIIAEVKHASPSQGVIRPDFKPLEIASEYAIHGASALSVVTEEEFFGGELRYLEEIRQIVPLPLLRKDFIIDPYQLLEARAFGADAVLLIVAALEKGRLRDLLEQSVSLSLDALVEVHTESELAEAVGMGADLIGVNNRDLKTFEVSLSVSERLLQMIPSDVVAVCESGISRTEHITQLEAAGAHVFLIGEAFMRSDSPGAKLAELLQA